MLDNALNFAKKIISAHVRPGDSVIDATVGNGNDTVFLSELVGEKGRVYGFDIQQQAIDTTEKILSEKKISSWVKLFLAGHERMEEFIPAEEEISAVMFNLGYLPRSDKNIITRSETTIVALNSAIKLLSSGGIITIVAYIGHDGGSEEADSVRNAASALDQKDFRVVEYRSLNQKNSPPFLIAVEKISE